MAKRTINIEIGKKYIGLVNGVIFEIIGKEPKTGYFKAKFQDNSIRYYSKNMLEYVQIAEFAPEGTKKQNELEQIT